MTTTPKHRLNAPPAELFNNVFALTFTTDRHVHTIEKTYKPPSCLHVNRSTRATFAKSYYGRGVAGKDNGNVTMFYIDQDDCPKWLKSLTQDHVNMLEEVRYRDYGIHIWAGSSEEVLKIVWEKDGRGMFQLLTLDVGPTPVLDPAQLCVPCMDVSKGNNNWQGMNNVLNGEEKYRSIADLENGVWSDLAKDDVPDFGKK